LLKERSRFTNGQSLGPTADKPDDRLLSDAYKTGGEVMPDLHAETQPDHLDRGRFLTALESNIQVLAEVPSDRLSTPRAIAVDARWGNGKTWVATELARRLTTKDTPQRVAFIDVFRYDHHDDPFAVIASSIYDTLKPTGTKKKQYLAAAGSVLKSAAPVAAKAAITLGARAIGLNAEDQDELKKMVVDGVKDGAAALSEKAIEKLFDSYSKTEQIQNKFMETLAALTSELEKPLVVIIDELDRCRPSFTLEVLERIKHLFGADKVVFVLFWNSASIHESIRHTYGAKTDAEDYLAKFVAFSIRLEMPKARVDRIGARYDTFIRAIADQHFPSNVDSYGFREALRSASGVLEPSLRQLQRAVQLAAQTKAQHDEWPTITAFLFLLKSIDEVQFAKISRLDPTTANSLAEAMRPHMSPEEPSELRLLYSIFAFAANVPGYEPKVRAIQTGTQRADDLSEEDRQIIQRTDGGKYLRLFTNHAAKVFAPLTSG
jgi:hypothetical protein